ncbi:Ribonuclease III [hydrothermal vent metagenome]|uniref:ribonuclease III n=1 Tax=hydrothermal vent metagenome TaxID=652676 RepID=A0A3B1CIS5_9ZZZZ
MPVSFSRSLKKLESALDYTFRDPSLLIEAVTHSSFSNEHPDEAPGYNERLEFLGDAVLGLSVVEELFRVEAILSESDMAKLKSFLVSRPVLSEAARGLELGMVLRLGKGEETSGGRDKENILADALEAVVGAVFIDSDYYVARKVILHIIGKKIENTIKTRKSHDYKTELQELTQDIYGSLPEYRVVKEEGEEHNKTFTVEVLIGGEYMGSGKGKSKKEAQMKAANEALRRLTIDD